MLIFTPILPLDLGRAFNTPAAARDHRLFAWSAQLLCDLLQPSAVFGQHRLDALGTPELHADRLGKFGLAFEETFERPSEKLVGSGFIRFKTEAVRRRSDTVAIICPSTNPAP
jgi:hypothetical protein